MVSRLCLVWDGFWVGKKQREVWQARPCLFWSGWKARKGVVFRDEIFSTQRLKISFVIPSLVETKLSIVNGLSTLVEFID